MLLTRISVDSASVDSGRLEEVFVFASDAALPLDLCEDMGSLVLSSVGRGADGDLFAAVDIPALRTRMGGKNGLSLSPWRGGVHKGESGMESATDGETRGYQTEDIHTRGGVLQRNKSAEENRCQVGTSQ